MGIIVKLCRGIFMAPTWYSASAPGTLMLLGEHAVLHDKPALVAAIDKRINVKLVPRNDNKILIESSLGKLELDLLKYDVIDLTEAALNNSNQSIQNAFRFVVAAIKDFPIYTKTVLNETYKLPSGFELQIRSDFSSQIGFGSSAAVTVAVVAVLLSFANSAMADHKAIEIFQMAKWVIQKVQKVGSGADVLTAVFGGMIIYQQQSPYLIKKISTETFPDLIAVYSGYKTPTPEVIQFVNAAYKSHSNSFDSIFSAMGCCVEKAIPALETQDWTTLVEIFNIHQGLMQAIGVSTPLLDTLCYGLKAENSGLGAKISGSGLGDCIIGLGAPGSLAKLPPSHLQQNLRKKIDLSVQTDKSINPDNIQIFPIQISEEGLRFGQ